MWQQLLLSELSSRNIPASEQLGDSVSEDILVRLIVGMFGTLLPDKITRKCGGTIVFPFSWKVGEKKPPR